jgi:hypothetical protein
MKGGYGIPIAHEMGSMERNLDSFKQDLKDADDDLKEMEYNLYKSIPMFESLEHFKDAEKIKISFQIENDRVLAEAMNYLKNEKKLKKQINTKIVKINKAKNKYICINLSCKKTYVGSICPHCKTKNPLFLRKKN